MFEVRGTITSRSQFAPENTIQSSMKTFGLLFCLLVPANSFGSFELRGDNGRTCPSLCRTPFLNHAFRGHSRLQKVLSESIPNKYWHLPLKKKLTEVSASCAENEWGVPLSADLPSLADNKKRPLPKQLPNGGKVTLLGAGPGDPDLLTVVAYRLLTEVAAKENALVVVDRLVSPEILDLIKAPEVKVARKLPGCADLAQEEIYWWCYQGLNQGRHVIRLKIGDPFVFGRGGEEVLKFREFGVEPTVIPGVSAAFSAPLLGNIPVTHRGVSNQVVMCTGYGRNGTSPDLIRYHKEQTIVFLMAVGRLKELCDRLTTMAGYPTDTPVAIVERAGFPDQRTFVGDISTIADLGGKHQVKAPSTIVVGNVVRVLLDEERKGKALFGNFMSYADFENDR